MFVLVMGIEREALDLDITPFKLPLETSGAGGLTQGKVCLGIPVPYS